MTEEKTKESVDFKEVAGKATGLAKNIWLAGLGAYAKAADGAQVQYDTLTGKVKDAEQKAEKTTATFFEDLVSKGKIVEETSQVKLSEVKEKATVSLEDRLSQVKANLKNMPKLAVGSSKTAQLADISEKLDTILASVTVAPVVSAPKKAAVKKTSAKATAEV